MKVPLDGADYGLAGGLEISRLEVRTQEVEGGIHGARCEEELGHKVLVLLEQLPHNPHARGFNASFED